MNAGTHTDWMSSIIESVVTYRPGKGLCYYERDDVYWAYRESGLPHDEVILETTLALARGSKADIGEKMERALARRRRTQPVGAVSCGSVFRNPPDHTAAALIEGCGLKGFSVGGAEVSEVHANFIVNKKSATAADVAAVIAAVYENVKETYGIELKPEVKFLGF